MEAVSLLHDGRIHADNVLFDYSIGEYLDAIRAAVGKNPYQRKRVASSKSIYTLLREDVVKGCVIPPIVLALTNIESQIESLTLNEAESILAGQSTNLIILDGLQRTLTLLDLESELIGKAREKFRSKPLRVEIYMGLNKIGILYRMLTLNTGQTPMSLRHQIEMLYIDYLDAEIDGVRFVREIDEQRATSQSEINFKDAIEGFNSYLERDELPLDRSDLLENVKSLETLSQENSSVDIFKEYVQAWMAFTAKAYELCGESLLSAGDIPETNAPWGKTVTQVFRKAQAMAGFGAALGKLKDFEKLSSLAAVPGLLTNLTLDAANPEEFLLAINKAMLRITANTKKIGNAQRMFFHYYFREMLNPESDSYLQLNGSVNSAVHKLMSQLY
jgi:hypothetical protein